MSTVKGVAQAFQVRGGQALVVVGIAQQNVTLRGLPFIVGQPYPGGAIGAQGLEVGLVGRQTVEAVATMAGGVPEVDEVCGAGQRRQHRQQTGKDPVMHGASRPIEQTAEDNPARSGKWAPMHC